MNYDNHHKPEIIIAGAGWSGLAAAVQLTAQGFPVKLLEAASEAGGRARNITISNQSLDNGQHLLLGAYNNVLTLLQLLDIHESDVLLRQPLLLNVHSPTDTGIQIRAAKLFSPFHILSGIMMASGFSVREKIKLMRGMLAFRLQKFTVNPDISVKQLLLNNKQTPRIIKLFWEPICVAALNTQIEKASANVLLQVLKKSFTRSRTNSDMLLPRVGLGQLIPSTALNYLTQHGSEIHFRERATKLIIDEHGIQSIQTRQGAHPCQYLVLALPFKQSLRLINEHSTIKSQLSHCKFEYEPVTTLYLQYPEHIRLENHIAGTADSTAQWLIDRRSCNQPGLIAAVISASGPHQKLDKQLLTNKVIAEISLLYPDWPAPLSTWLTREKQATFSCDYKTNHLRPHNHALGQNIWLAGDYIDPNLPATLEAAVQAGLQCANQIINQFK